MEKFNTLTFLIGPPASGKTTYANTYLKNESTVILSSDDIRKELLNDVQNQSNNKLVFDTLYSRAKDFLKSGKNVVLDCTNTDKNFRQLALDYFKEFNIIKKAIIFKTTKQECLLRDEKRERQVGKNVIENFFENISIPTEEEGFNEIIEIN